MRNVENVKNGQIPKKKLNLVVLKQENHNLSRITAIMIERESIFSLLALIYKLTKLNEKWMQSSISQYFFINQIFLKAKTTISCKVINQTN